MNLEKTLTRFERDGAAIYEYIQKSLQGMSTRDSEKIYGINRGLAYKIHRGEKIKTSTMISIVEKMNEQP